MAQAIRIKNPACSATFEVAGLDCPDCAAKVEKAVQKIPGVISAAVAFPMNKMKVEYDASQTGVSQVIDKVKVLGYNAVDASGDTPSADNETVSLRIEGMDCADCAGKLEKVVSQVPGVRSAEINFGNSKMKVTHQGNIGEILTVIARMGYTVQVDEGIPMTERVSFLKTNQYAIPTVISFAMLVLGLVTQRMAVPDMVPIACFVTGIILGGFLPARNGISVLLNAHELDMNILMALAVIGAVGIGQFEEAIAVVFLFSLGNTLQGYTLDKTRNSIRSLMDLTPKEALVSRNGTEITLPVADVQVDDLIIVRPGEKIAMDGKVIEGFSSVNQAPITGESLPVEKKNGDEVYAGTVNERGSLKIQVTRLAQDNTISRIINMVEEAQGQRAPSQQFVDRFAKYYTPAVLVGAILVAVIPAILGQPFHIWFYQALAMLLIACPCALVISTPVSIVSAIGSAAKSGVLVKGGVYLEEAAALSVIAFDKTGTLTVGQPQVTDIVPMNGYSPPAILGLAAAIESRSEHPLGQAILNYARDNGVEIPVVHNFAAVWGKGAQGDIEGRRYQIGNTRLFTDNGFNPDNLEEIGDTIAALQNEGKTVMILGDEKKIIGVFAVADVIRANSQSAIKSLKQAGIKKVVMLTGDNRRTAQAIANKLGIDDFRAELLPEDKVAAIKDLLAQHHKIGMVGDGVNDAPAMAISSVGVAMGVAGTDAALETADIALMADDLTKLAYIMRLSRKTLSIIKQNIILALLIKGLILLLVIPGWLTLWLAVVGDMGSSLLVTLNGMRLLRVRHRG
ncbi:MAG: heavy metal translocating P-type ATPase [Syntrophomonas sp.]|nr:heavy metal translocating P-type ATPase [Syntrophomonas sp.]